MAKRGKAAREALVAGVVRLVPDFREGEDAAKFADVPNLVLTPHIAGVTEESNVRVSTLIAETVLNHLS